MVAANATVATAESIYEDLTDDKKQSVGEVIANATIDAGLSALFTYVGYSPSAGKSLNAMYSAKKAAKNIGSGFVDNSKKALSYTFKEITKAIIGW